ncbi:MAG: OsmC family protein [Alphaproteobacteria bacterium]
MAQSFKTVVAEAQKALREAPDTAVVAFEAESRQISGLHSRANARQFALDIDEPPELGGTDKGPNPAELALAALAACQEITYRLFADSLEIPLDGVSVKLEGTLDLRGFLDIDPNVRPGFLKIQGTVTLDSPASDEDLTRLREKVNRHCPLFDIIREATPVSLDLKHVRAGGEAAGFAAA